MGFIAIKLFFEALDGTTDLEVPHVTIAQSLMFILLTLGVTVITSLAAVKRDPTLALASQAAHTTTEAIEHRGEALEHIPDENSQT